MIRMFYGFMMKMGFEIQRMDSLGLWVDVGYDEIVPYGKMRIKPRFEKMKDLQILKAKVYMLEKKVYGDCKKNSKKEKLKKTTTKKVKK